MVNPEKIVATATVASASYRIEIECAMHENRYQRYESLGGMMNVIAYRIRRDFALRLREHGLDLAVWPVLVCLWENDGVPQARIGELLGVPGYTTSRGVDRLVEIGLVSRQNDPHNRRIRRVFLTESGRQIQATLVPLAAESNDVVLGLLNEAEQHQLLDLLRKIMQRL